MDSITSGETQRFVNRVRALLVTQNPDVVVRIMSNRRTVEVINNLSDPTKCSNCGAPRGPHTCI